MFDWLFGKESLYYGIKDECCVDSNIDYIYMFDGKGIYSCKTCKRVFRMKNTLQQEGNQE